MDLVSDLLDRLDAALRATRPDFYAHLAPGATEADLAHLEAALGLPLPDPFKAFLRWKNGYLYEGTLPPDKADCLIPYSIRMLGTQDILGAYELQRDLASRFPHWLNREGFWSTLWIPFLWDFEMVYSCIDLGGSFTGIAGQVVEYSRDQISVDHPSFLDWLETVTLAYEAGLITFAPDSLHASQAAYIDLVEDRHAGYPLRDGRPPASWIPRRRAPRDSALHNFPTLPASWVGRPFAESPGPVPDRGSLPVARPVDQLRGLFAFPALVPARQVRRLGLCRIHGLYPTGGAQVVVLEAGGAGLFDVATGQALWEIACPADCGTVDPAGRWLALGYGPRVHLWDLRTGALAQTFGGPRPQVRSLAFHPGGDLLACGGPDQIVLRSLTTRQVVHTLTGLRFPADGLAFNPTGTLLATTDSIRVHVWQVADGTRQQILRGSTDPVFSLAFTPAGDHLATGCGDSMVRLWDVTDGHLVRLFTPTNGASVAFAPDGQTLAMAAWRNTIQVTPVAAGVSPAELTPAHQFDIWEQSIPGWRLSTDTPGQTLRGHTDWVAAVVFTPDGQHLMSGGFDATMRLWRVGDGALLHTLQGFPGSGPGLR